MIVIDQLAHSSIQEASVGLGFLGKDAIVSQFLIELLMTDLLSIVGKEKPTTRTILNSYKTLQTPSPSVLFVKGVLPPNMVRTLCLV